MSMIYGKYLAASGQILVGDVDVARTVPREILHLRRETLGYVSQFLRDVPRVATVDVVSKPLIAVGAAKQEACEKAEALLGWLNIPCGLWQLSPTTFSDGEQQRANIARGLLRLSGALA